MKQPGLAKTQFLELHKRAPWISNHKPVHASNWPLFDRQLAQNRITYLDYVLTHRLLRDEPQASEESALFICHLILAARKGHLCIKTNDSSLSPSVAELWNDETEQPLPPEQAESLERLILEGSNCIPTSLQTVTICQHNRSFYLQRHWVLESLFLEGLSKQCRNEPFTKIDFKLDEKTLNKEQANAIEKACRSPISIISGGPGTGKTYTAGQLIRVLWNHLSHEEQSSFRIVLAAPTGKAAAHLQKSLTDAVSNLENFPVLQAKTLHSLLNLNQRNKDSEIRISADLIVVDESSMIDLKTMAYLFKALKKGCRLVLLGDPFQLPAVEAGSLFLDLIELGTIPHTELKTCLRTELASIIDLAKLIKEGREEQTLNCLNQAKSEILRRPFSEDPKEAQKELVNYVSPLFRAFPHDDQTLDKFNAVRLLSPMRKGPFGVDLLNQLIWQQISQSAPSQGWIAIPIMIVTNDYRQDLFNGETGVLMRKLPLELNGSEDYALFPGRSSNDDARRFSSVLLPKYEYAYCLSVHKSQGSEFDRVILVLPEGSEVFGREVFYTATTRARRQIEIYGSDDTIRKTVERQVSRVSGIHDRFDLALRS